MGSKYTVQWMIGNQIQCQYYTEWFIIAMFKFFFQKPEVEYAWKLIRVL